MALYNSNSQGTVLHIYRHRTTSLDPHLFVYIVLMTNKALLSLIIIIMKGKGGDCELLQYVAEMLTFTYGSPACSVWIHIPRHGMTYACNLLTSTT